METQSNAAAANVVNGIPADDAAQFGDKTVSKVAQRLMWFLMALYFCAIMDRGNVSFAALSMNREIGLTPQMFGMGIGVMYITYSLFEIPSNLFLGRYGARATLTRIAILWGVATMLMALAQGPASFYTLRALLGAAEAGLFPGVMLYLSLWFPRAYLARYNAMFSYAVPLSYMCSSLISGAILNMDGMLGLQGWKWLFILEGIPAVALGIFGIRYLTNRPKEAEWLTESEKAWLENQIEPGNNGHKVIGGHSLMATLANPIVLALGLCNFGLFFGLASLPYWLPQIIKGFHLSNVQIGVVSALPPLAGLIGMIFLSRYSDRTGKRFTNTATTLFIAAAGFAIVAFAEGAPLTILGFMVANIGVYATQAIFWTIPQTYLSKQTAPGAFGAIGMMGSAGGAIVPMAIGFLKDFTHSFTAGFLMVAFVLASAGAIILICRASITRGGPST
ncbi:MFS transporter [Undibacterium sp. TJN25]|uniref:MFS transporter n=1 Tax=Undibacterium sp. TJN25 TaxID=3413056 RepID=UPI003BF09FC1